MDQHAEEKSSTGKIVVMSCLIAVGALVTVGVLAVVGSIFFFRSTEGTSTYEFSISTDSADENPLENFAPIEPEDGPPPDFFDDLNSSADDDE